MKRNRCGFLFLLPLFVVFFFAPMVHVVIVVIIVIVMVEDCGWERASLLFQLLMMYVEGVFFLVLFFNIHP